MKVLLLNDGGYEGLEGLNFPIAFAASAGPYNIVRVPANSLIDSGADPYHFCDLNFYAFPIGDGAKILNEVLTSVRTPSGLRSANVGYTVSGKEISVHTIESVGGTDLIDEVDGASMLLLKISLAAIEEKGNE